MKKTFTTIMPDKVGAFLAASEIMRALGLNITRVSYNKAVDAHMLFIEAEGDAEAIERATALLAEKGYLPNRMEIGGVILLEFRLRDVPGSVQPVLKLISSFNFNISYISSQENGTGYQQFRMGLFIEDGADVSAFLRRASQLCDVRIVNYDKTEKILDNTVFYMSFANQIAEEVGLDEALKRSLIVNSNLIMEMLNARSSPPYKTFEYIGKFAEMLCRYHGEKYSPRLTEYSPSDGVQITLIEPPCGSNICIIDSGGGLLMIDSGFACYERESMEAVYRVYPDFDSRRRDAAITHADVDHCGLLGHFDRVFLSRKCFLNFERERGGEDNFRELNPVHAPYVRISKILSGYVPPDEERLCVIGGGEAPLAELIAPIGRLRINGLDFEVYEGRGGHVAGETIYIERAHRMLFTGDVFVNIREFTPEQAAFNRLAPYLMTSVDTDPETAAKERDAIFGLLESGEWLLFSGHGRAKTIEIR